MIVTPETDAPYRFTTTLRPLRPAHPHVGALTVLARVLMAVGVVLAVAGEVLTVWWPIVTGIAVLGLAVVAALLAWRLGAKR